MTSVSEAWSACRGWLTPALTDCTEAEVVDALEGGLAQLWQGERAAMVTQLVNAGGVRRLHVLLGGGDLAELLALQPGVLAWARVMGAQFATIHGRPGWARVLARHGFEDRQGELWKALRQDR